MSKKPESYSEDEKRLAELHRCHPHLFSDPLALRHSIQLAKIEQKLKEIERKLAKHEIWLGEIDKSLDDLEKTQRIKEQIEKPEKE